MVSAHTCASKEPGWERHRAERHGQRSPRARSPRAQPSRWARSAASALHARAPCLDAPTMGSRACPRRLSTCGGAGQLSFDEFVKAFTK